MFTSYSEGIRLTHAEQRLIIDTRDKWKPGDEYWSTNMRMLISVGDYGVSVSVWRDRDRKEDTTACVNDWKNKSARQIISDPCLNLR